VDHWFKIENVEAIPSPSLLVYPERIEANIRSMLRLAPAARLRPHVKTHKMAEVISVCLQYGINKFKTTTLAEAEMCALAGASDVLLAYQPVGPNIGRLHRLATACQLTQFSALVDNETSAEEISAAFSSQPLNVWVDIDCGMHRTGVPPAGVVDLVRKIAALPGLQLRGLHAYDGHIHSTDLTLREEEYKQAMDPVFHLRNQLQKDGKSLELVAGGTPTFPFNARLPGIECSPGTPLLWDAGYTKNYPDLPFEIAAAVLCRVVSNPTPNHYCVDLGHKAIASENPQPRLWFPEIPDAELVSHSEEHLMVRTARDLPLGTPLYAFPRHICPTCALYDEAVVVRGGRAVSQWKVHRGRSISC
jgi:D-serine deaminase-like pyridoxal phosphate-dependent protein